MKPYLQEKPIQTNVNSTQFNIELGEQELSKISRLLITNQYSNPLKAALREIISNAYDANTLATSLDHVSRPVDITVDKDRVIIRDYGSGLSPEEMTSLYTLIGKSSKEDNQELIGAFGVGRLAPLAVSDSFYITSYYNGTASLYCCYLNELHIPSLALWNEEETNKFNGLEVTVLFKEWELCRALKCLTSLVRGSRHTINYTVTKETQDYVFSQLLPYSFDKPSSDAWKESLASSVDLFNEGYIFSVTDPESHIQYDFYATYEFKSEYETRLEVVYDLGGALYPQRVNKGQSASNRVDYLSNEQRLLRQQLVETLINLEDLTVREQLTKVQSIKEDPHHIKPIKFCIIARLQPDTLRLTTSREELLKDELNNEKMQCIYSQAITSVHQEIQRRVTKLCLSQQIKGKDLYEKIRVASSLTDVVAKTLQSLPSSIGIRRYSYPYNLDNDGNVVFVHDEANYTPQEGKTEIIIPHSSSRDNEPHLNIDNSDYYYLCYGDDVNTNLCYSFKDGVYKRKPHKGRALTTKDICQWNYKVITSDKTLVSRKELRQQFGEEVANSPILVVAEKYSDKLGSLPYVNYLGAVQTTETSKKTTTEPCTDDREISILLRQLRTRSYNCGFCLLYCYRQGHYRSTSKFNVLINEDKINHALLQERVIYGLEESSRDCLDFTIIQKLPTFYLKDYYPYANIELSDNAYDRVLRLKRAGLCNWVSVGEVVTEVVTYIVKHNQDLLRFVTSDGYGVLKEIEPYLKEFIPKPILNTLRWNEKYVEACEEIETYAVKRNILKASEFYSKALNEYFGEELKPYYPALNHLSDIAPSERKAVYRAIAFTLNAQRQENC